MSGDNMEKTNFKTSTFEVPSVKNCVALVYQSLGAPPPQKKTHPIRVKSTCILHKMFFT